MINKKRQDLIIQNLRSISAEVRSMSIEQLVNFPSMPAAEKISCLEQVLDDADEGVRNLAATMIQKLKGDAGAAPAYSAPVQPASPTPVSPQSPVSMPAAPPSRVQTAVPAGAIPPAAESGKPLPVAELDDPVDPSLPDLKKMTDIGALLQHIRMLSVKKPAGHLTQLLQLSKSVMEEVALTALQSLFNLKDHRIPPQITPMLAEEQYSSQRRFLMLKIIMETDVELDAAGLESILMKEKDVIVKSGLVKVFARSSRESGIGTLIRCLQDEDPRVRANTVEVIEEQNIRGCEQQIVTLLEDPENRVKVNAAKYLVKNGFQQAFLTLRSMLVSPEVWLRDSVIFALGEIGDQASLTLLKAALKDPNQGIRLSVLKALARINNNTSRQVLKAACGDPDPVVAQVAASLFEKIKDTPAREETRQVSPAMPTVAAKPQPPAVTAPVVPVSAAVPVASPPQDVARPAVITTPESPARPESVLPSLPDAPGLPVIPADNEEVAAPPQPKPVVRAPAQKPVQPLSPSPAAPVPMTPLPAAQAVPKINIPDRRLPSAAAPLSRPVSAPPQEKKPVVSVPGMPAFSRPRSAEIYARLVSGNVDEQRAGARDIAFVMGDDQMLLIAKAATLEDESIRIAAVKLLSRKKTPDAIELLQKLTGDSNETVKSLAEKALQLQK